MKPKALRTVLILSYYFAPSEEVGAKRFSYLASELERLGYDVRVVASTKLLRRHQAGGAPDASLPVVGGVRRRGETLSLPLEGRGVAARLANAFWRRVLAPIGWEVFWIGPAAREALDLAREAMNARGAGAEAEKGVVIVTMPPAAAAIAGMRIARRLGWPLILDYRDPWSAYPWPRSRKGRIAQAVARSLERFAVARSSARVLNTSAMREWFERYFPTAPGRNVVISNGVDRVTVAHTPAIEEDGGVLYIVHAGSIYTDRSLVPVLKALAAIAARHPERTLRLVMYGELQPLERQRIEAAGVMEYLEVHAPTSRNVLLERLRRARVLLAVSGADMTYSVPYKMYDYLTIGRPVLALSAADSALQRFIAESGTGVCVDPRQDGAIEAALEELLFAPAPLADPTRAERYLWSNLALQYRDTIESVCAERVPTMASGLHTIEQRQG